MGLGKVLVVGALGYVLLNQTNLAEMTVVVQPPPEDNPEGEVVTEDHAPEEEVITGTSDLNDPLALLGISLGTSLGISAITQGVKAVVKPKVPPADDLTKAAGKVDDLTKAAGKTDDLLVKKATKAAAEKAAAEAAEKAAREAAEKAALKAAEEAADRTAKEAAQKAAAEAAEKAAKEAAEKAAQKAAAEAAEKAAAKAAAKAAKGSKASSLMTKLKGTPADLIVMVISQILVAALDLDPENFEVCANGEFDMNSLPDWAKAIISGVPFLGDLFDLIGDKLCIKSGCPPGTENENGLCYEACKPGFKSDGAVMCYKQYPDWEANGMLHTITSITKNTLMDTGTPPDTCPPQYPVRSGELCYEARPGFTNVAGTVWEDCPPGFTDTGVRCENVIPIPAGTAVELEDCPPGWRTDPLTCYHD